jgi:hypothetical protein
VEHVVADAPEVVVALDAARGKTALEEVAGAIVQVVEVLRVAEAEEVHPLRQPLELGEHDEVEVVRHERVDRERPAEAARGSAQQAKEGEAVVVVEVDGAAFDATIDYVEGAVRRKVPARLSCHCSRR